MERVSFLVGRSIELDVVCAPLDQPQPHNLLLHGVAQLVPLYPVTQRHPGLQAGLILTAVITSCNDQAYLHNFTFIL